MPFHVVIYFDNENTSSKSITIRAEKKWKCFYECERYDPRHSIPADIKTRKLKIEKDEMGKLSITKM